MSIAHKFTGKERDDESGLDNFGARYYTSTYGRFMTPDWAAKPSAVPYANFGNPQSLNLYSYVENNPTTFGDPDGHAPPCTSSGNNCTELQLSKIFVALQVDVSPAGMAAAIAGAAAMDGIPAPPAWTPPIVSQTLKDIGTMITDSASNLASRVAAGLDGLVDTGAATSVAVPALVVTGAVLATPQTMGTGDVLSPAQMAAQSNRPRSTLPRAENGDFLPDPGAQGAHSTIGTRVGSNGVPYRQGATFDASGKFQGRTDVTDHGRPQNHVNPHYHPTKSANGVGEGVPVIRP